MPIDPTIPLQVRPFKMKSPREHEAEELTLYNLGSQAQQNKLQLEAAQEAAGERKAIRGVFAGNPNPTYEQLVQIAPEFAQKYALGVKQLRTEDLQQAAAYTKMMSDAYTNLEVQPEAQRSAMWPHVRQRLTQMGVPEGMLPKQYDPIAVGQLADQAKIAEVASKHEAEQRAKTKAGQETEEFEAKKATGFATGDVAQWKQSKSPLPFLEWMKEKTAATSTDKPSLAEQTAEQWLKQNPGKTLVDYQTHQASLNDPTGLRAVQTVDASGRPVTRFAKATEGAEFVAPPTADQLNRSAAIKTIDPILSGISELSEKINVLNGVIAKASGEVEKAKARVNLNDDVAEYEALISGFTPMVARAVGHTGVLTQQDVDSVKAMFPRPGDSKSLRDRKIARIKTILGAQGTAPAAGGGPAAGAADPLGIR